MNQAFHIFSLSAEDAPALSRLVGKARPAESQNPESIAREMTAHSIRYYGAKADGALIGYAAAFVHTEPPDLLLTDLYTEESQGGAGFVAQALVKRAIAELGGGLAQVVLLHCDPQDTESIASWTREGFRHRGEIIGELVPDKGARSSTHSAVLSRSLTGMQKALGIRGVIFDMDGLLLDTESLYLLAWPQVGAAMNLPITLSAAKEAIGVCIEEHEKLFQRHYGPAFTMEKALPIMDAWIRDYVAQKGLPVKPGARELLELLREKGIRSALGSSNLRYVVEEYLESAALRDCFEVLVAGDMVPARKPAPDIFLRAAKEMGLSPAQCLVLEDSPVGIAAAHRAGCIPAMVPDQLKPKDSTYGQLWRTFSSLEQLPLALF